MDSRVIDQSMAPGEELRGLHERVQRGSVVLRPLSCLQRYSLNMMVVDNCLGSQAQGAS